MEETHQAVFGFDPQDALELERHCRMLEGFVRLRGKPRVVLDGMVPFGATWTSLAASHPPVSYTHLRAHETGAYL
eukprot:4730497-Pyramimonas_sp.AAC.1